MRRMESESNLRAFPIPVALPFRFCSLKFQVGGGGRFPVGDRRRGGALFSENFILTGALAGSKGWVTGNSTGKQLT